MKDQNNSTGFRKEIEIGPWGKIVIEIYEGKGNIHKLQIKYDGNFPENFRRNVETVLRKKHYIRKLSVIKVPQKEKFQ